MRSLFIKFLISVLFFSFSVTFIFADENCELNEWFDLYKCRVENICEQYMSDKKAIYETEDYEELTNSSDWFENAKTLYRDNMNNIYKCAILQAQKNSLNLFKSKLLWIEKSWELKSRVLNKVDSRLNKIDSEFSKLWCKWIEKEDIINKDNVLAQTTYELCKHISYMEYLREYNKNVKNALWIDDSVSDDTKYPVTFIADEMKKKKTEVDDEISHSYKVFPLAFNAYSEYENNYTLHIFLELIKEDFLIFRDKLHDAINPINQVVYKIANAMSNSY